jgi:hypothetical protein
MKCNTTRHRQNRSKFSRMRKVVHNFFERDDNRNKANNYKTDRQTTKKIHARYIKKFVHEI